MAISSSSEEGLTSSVSTLMYAGGRSKCSIVIGGDFLSMSSSDMDDLLPDLSDDWRSDLFFLRIKTHAVRTASAAPKKMHPIAMPIVWPRESADSSFNGGKAVGTKVGDARETSVVGVDGLSLGDVRDAHVKFAEIVLDGVTVSVKAGEVAASPLVVAKPVENDPGDAFDGGNVFMYIVPPFVPLVTIAKSTGVGTGEDVWFA